MSDADKPKQGDDESERQALEDLDVGEDADKVVGGGGDPCMGGEIRRPR
jgi:hypothetical protein